MKRINLRDLLTPLENAAYMLPINMHITESLKKTQIPPFDSYSLASHSCSKATASQILSLDPEGLYFIVLFSEGVLSLFFLEISSST